jgi:predicted RNase H-like HicB family nuclease
MGCAIIKGKGGDNMTHTYTAKYTKIPSGYMGQLIEWPEVITEGKTIEKCREMLQDALKEMIAACKVKDNIQSSKQVMVRQGLS